MSLLAIGQTLVLVFFAQTMSSPVTYYSLARSSMTPTPTCQPCCDTRRQGDLIVQAEVFTSDDCITTTVSSTEPPTTTTEMMTTTEYCIPCCDRRRHGIVVIRASVITDDIESEEDMYYRAINDTMAY